ncbi:MAG TPA: hypothetical protein VFT95_02780 [Micromonosporaceae bacterium]|nr:hypothetical protein [Micromonosporaceae bacterium]
MIEDCLRNPGSDRWLDKVVGDHIAEVAYPQWRIRAGRPERIAYLRRRLRRNPRSADAVISGQDLELALNTIEDEEELEMHLMRRVMRLGATQTAIALGLPVDKVERVRTASDERLARSAALRNYGNYDNRTSSNGK